MCNAVPIKIYLQKHLQPLIALWRVTKIKVITEFS